MSWSAGSVLSGGASGQGAGHVAVSHRQNMTITRLASAGTRRTWFRPAPRCLLGAAAPGAALARGRRGSKHVARRRPRGRRGIAEPGPDSHRAGCQPGRGCGAALPPGQFLAGRDWPWLVVFRLRRPRRNKPAERITQEQDTAMAADGQAIDRPSWAGCARAGAAARAARLARRLAGGRRTGCPPSSTPSQPTGPATAPASFRPPGSPRTRAPSSTTWTRAASHARCSWATPTAAGWRCRRRAWRPAGWRPWSCSRASALGA